MTIAGSGNTQVNVYYTRNSYRLTWNWVTGSKVETYQYEQAVSKIANPVRTGYTFEGWDGEIPGMSISVGNSAIQPALPPSMVVPWARSACWMRIFSP